MGKFVLPRFGGGPSVWSTSLLVFQVLLLAGYAYVALISRKLPVRLQTLTHGCLLGFSGVILAIATPWRHSPLLPAATAPDLDHPVWQITLMLFTAVGVQCVALSATSPLLQSWFSHQHKSSPYRLYALSNLGSILGLLTYPFLVEPILRLSTQAWTWTISYVVFLILTGACAFLLAKHEPANIKAPTLTRVTGAGTPARASFNLLNIQSGLWLALAACSCTMLLATTNLICQQVAPVPLLWVLPLSLYLLSFIICFDHPRWYRREVFCPLYFILALLALWMLPKYTDISIAWLVSLYCGALFAVCMCCHGELARLKPAPEHLTSFYLMISFGGALGSAFVVLLAPILFDRFWEFQIALLGCGMLLLFMLLRDKTSWVYSIRFGRGILASAVVIMVLGSYIFTAALLIWEGQGGDAILSRTRNFFGIKTVANLRGYKVLSHGHTLHGVQSLNPAKVHEPTLYYARKTGIGLLLSQFPRNESAGTLRVGVIGMGAGTLAAYGHPGDYFRFYEIDPAIAELSLAPNPLFTFVQSSQAHIDVVLGDARVKMQQEVSRGDVQNFDVLVVDAFSGDSVPVHLLTREAMEIYLRQLRSPQSVLAFHLSTSVLNLRPVVEGLALAFNFASIEVDAQGPIWVFLSKDPAALNLPALSAVAHPVENKDIKRSIPLWTDDYSSLYPLFQ